MPTLSHRGHSHMVLRHLCGGASEFAAIVTATRYRDRTKVFRVLLALRDFGFITHGFDGYAITAEGLHALARLDEGEDVEFGGVPNVRIFRRQGGSEANNLRPEAA